MTIYESFGLRLTRLRQERGLSQQALAEALSVTRQAVSSWERGRTAPDLGMLSRLCQVLEVDWNRLCGETEPPPRRTGGPVPLAAGAAVALLLIAALLALPLGRDRAPAEPPARSASSGGAQAAIVRHSQQVTAWEAGPTGLRKRAARLLADQLESLEGDAAVTPELRQSFALAAEACEFRFLPAYQDGEFSDRDAVLTWLYRGLSQGYAPTMEQVDGWIGAWFDSSARWEHGSTEHYALQEDGAYWPESAYSGGCVYTLRSLERREDGGFLAVLALEETDGLNRRLPERTLTLALAAEAGQLRFSSVAWEEAV